MLCGCAMRGADQAKMPTESPATELPKTTDDEDFLLSLDARVHVDNPEVRAVPLGNTIHSLIDSEMGEMILSFLEADKAHLDEEFNTCQEILQRTPADAKAIADEAYLKRMIPRFESVIKIGTESLAKAKEEWENHTPPGERARQRMWQQAYYSFQEQGFQNDEAAAEADKSFGPMPGPTKPWAIEAYDDGWHLADHDQQSPIGPSTGSGSNGNH